MIVSRLVEQVGYRLFEHGNRIIGWCFLTKRVLRRATNDLYELAERIRVLEDENERLRAGNVTVRGSTFCGKCGHSYQCESECEPCPDCGAGYSDQCFEHDG